MTALGALAAYLLGSIPASFIAGKIAGVDLRQQGSKSLGATNVWRVLGPRYAIPAGLFDVAKGSVAAIVFGRLPGIPDWGPFLAGGAAILGHVFPVYLRFRGGKGVATAAGVLLALAPGALGIAALAWLGVVLASGYVSLASMTAGVVFPAAAWLLMPGEALLIATGICLGGFVIYTHRTNIRRLVDGTESRFGRHGKAAQT